MSDQTPALFPSPLATALLVESVLATLTSAKTKQAYATALREFLAGTASRAGRSRNPCSKNSAAPLTGGLSVSSVNHRLSAVRLDVRHLQLREERWVLLDTQGKGSRIHTVPVPLWVQGVLDRWLTDIGIRKGPLFRS